VGTMASIGALLVDDDPDARDLIAASLSRDPVFAIHSCASGMEALAATAEWSPDLILLDVMMPDMDGPATFARLQERPQISQVPVIFVTGLDRPDKLAELQSTGAAGVISKPFDPISLPTQVQLFVAEHRVAMRRKAFLTRAHADAEQLVELRQSLAEDEDTTTTLQRIKSIACAIGEEAYIAGFLMLTFDAAALEQAITATNSRDGVAEIEHGIDNLLARIGGESVDRRNVH
jgi:two-component system OmpR family response regulator